MEYFAAVLLNGLVNKFTLVDLEDLEKVSPCSWYAEKNHCDNYYAANRHFFNKTQKMHRLIMGAKKGQIVDHINHDTLDNRKSNLRFVTSRQNQMNRKPVKKGSSKFKGVYLVKKSEVKRYIAQLQHEGEHYYLGYHKSEIEAARAYNKKALELFGEFAFLNKLGE